MATRAGRLRHRESTEFGVGFPAFTRQVVCLGEGVDKCIPVGYYTDKVKYSQRDSFVRAAVGCTWRRTRITLWVVQERYVCQCGCGGRCTLNTLQVACNKHLNLMQMGQDATGRRLAYGHGVLCEYKADMPERAHVSGWVTWERLVATSVIARNDTCM